MGPVSPRGPASPVDPLSPGIPGLPGSPCNPISPDIPTKKRRYLLYLYMFVYLIVEVYGLMHVHASGIINVIFSIFIDGQYCSIKSKELSDFQV